MDLSHTTDLEKNSLEAHVDLCAMRYQQLDNRLSVLETKMDLLQQQLVQGQRSIRNTVITSSVTVVGGIISLIITIIMS
jgi:hypothetical protein